MLDEIDKLSASAHGDPTAALLEVLDPAQNNTFRDHYLGLPFDLSAVLFLATANVLEAIPLPLRDRMEIIELHGYTAEEKLKIARMHLLPRQRQASGLSEGVADVDDEVLAQVIERYTREAGVRQLERRLGSLMRHAAWTWAQEGRAPTRIGVDDLATILGTPPHTRETAMRLSMPGVVTGMAWTPAGGDILFVEASRVAGSNRVLLTGQLGEVMRESAQAALTLLKSRAAHLGLTAAAFEAVDVHVHVPAGAVPKDGPSAGLAMFLALASVFTGRAVAHDMAVTGEISLRGLVLPVGGVRDKVLAASRAGLSRVLLPVGNRADWADVPKSVQDHLTVRWVESVDEALEHAWTAPAEPGRPKPKPTRSPGNTPGATRKVSP
jgi:ATP-dependent Lon protease